VGEGADGGACFAVVAPGVGHPVECDLLDGCRSMWRGHASLSGAVGNELFQSPWVMFLVAGQHPHRFGVDHVGGQPPGCDVRKFVGADQTDSVRVTNVGALRKELIAMPAITVDDMLVLPRVPRPDPATSRARPVVRVVTAHRATEGAGFSIRRPFPGEVSMAESDPFPAAGPTSARRSTARMTPRARRGIRTVASKR
jgi:hypothetical protein